MNIDEFVANFSVVWEKCVTLRKCIRIGWPINREICIGVRACLRIVLDGGAYYVEADVNGKKFRWAIANKCYTVYSVAVGAIKICIEKISNGVRIQAKACIEFGPISECFNVYGVDVKFPRVGEMKARDALASILTASELDQLDDDTHLVFESEFDVSGVVECACD